jgi:hypothetical protein
MLMNIFIVSKIKSELKHESKRISRPGKKIREPDLMQNYWFVPDVA